MAHRKVHPEIVTKEDTALNTKLELGDLSHTKRNGLSSQDLQQSPMLPPPAHYKMLRRLFYETIEQIRDTRIVEKLGSIMPREQKKEELADFTQRFTEFLSCFQRIRDVVHRLNLREDTMTNDGEYFSDQLLRDFKDIENGFVDLVTTSSLRYLHKCCEIHELDDKGINLSYAAHAWGNDLRDYVYRTSPKFRKQPHSKQQSICALLCDCFASKKPNDSEQTSAQQNIQHQHSNNAVLAHSNTHLSKHISMKQTQN